MICQVYYCPNNGPATSALLGAVSGVALDSTGNLYIGDGNSKVVWAVNTGTNTATIAGVTTQPGNIATVAGNGTSAYSGDGGSATNAQLFYPSGIKLDGAGNIFFVDGGNSVVRALNEGANAVTIAGVTIQPGDIATVAGNFAPSNGLGDGGPALAAGFSGPSGLALDGAGNIYISDLPPENNRIRSVNTGTNPITIAGVTIQPGNIATVAGGAPNPNGCGCIWSGGDGGPATSAGLFNPEGLAVDSVGNIYIAESGSGRIRAVNTGTNPITIAGVTIQPGNIATVAGNGTFGYNGDGGPAIGAELNAPMDVALDSAGNLYIADTWNDAVRVVNTGTSVITVAGVTVQPGNIATVAGNGTSGYSGDGGPAISAQFINIVGLAVDGIGNIYVNDGSSSVVRVVNTSGIINTVAGNGTFGFSGDGGPATAAEFNWPSDVALDRSGNLYVTDSFNERIRKISSPATPTINWSTPESIVYGNGLSGTQLNATATYNGAPVAGTFVYTPPAGTVLGAGSQTLSVTFTPNDVADYMTAIGSVTVHVNRATPAIVWAVPAAINYGTALNGTQLDATSNVAGTLVYTPSVGTVLQAGTSILSVSFTPADSMDYTTSTGTVAIEVNVTGNLTVSAGQTLTFSNGSISGTLVMNGGTVVLNNTTIGGDLNMSGGSLTLVNNSAIQGNLTITGGTFSIDPSRINGNVQIQNLPSSSAQNSICATIIGGALQIQKNKATILIGSASCGGNNITKSVQISDNSAATALYGNSIVGNIQVSSNSAPTVIDANTVTGNVQVQNNSSSTAIFTNRVKGSLQCSGNNVSMLTGGGNTAAQKQGQCTGF